MIHHLKLPWQPALLALIMAGGYACTSAETSVGTGTEMAEGKGSDVPASPAGGDTLELVRFASSAAPLAVNSGLEQPANIVVTSRPEWVTMWQAIWNRQDPPPPLPEVDFGANVVVVAAMGTRPNSGYAVVVDSVYRFATHVEVVVRKVSPGASCITAQMMTAPLDAARIPRPDREVRFRDKAVVVECD
jgi:hypothetical protein